MIYLSSGLIITKEPQRVLEKLESLREDESFSIIDSGDREFILEDASKAIARAYITGNTKEYIILIAPKFSTIAQNRLLKIIEEPPPNREFIIITKSKSSILPTIKSRLPIIKINTIEKKRELDLDIENLNLEKVYNFIQKKRRVSPKESKELIETIAIYAIQSDRYNIDESLLNTFSKSIKALDVGSPAIFILHGVLLKLLSHKI